VIGATAVPPPAKVSATSRSFQTHRNWKMPKAASAGRSRGSSTRKKIATCPAPSIRAASSSVAGTSFMKLCSRNTASGRAKIECDNQIGQNVPAMPPST
jgi:hypothetical protein